MATPQRGIAPVLACIGIFSGEASAQVQTQTESSGVVYTTNTVYDGRRNDTYQTRITASLDGSTFLFDQTFFRALSDPSVQAGVAAATSLRGMAIDGMPVAIRWSTPTLVESYEEILDVFTESYTTTSAPTYFTTVQVTSGDAEGNFVYAGDRGGCFDFGASGSTNTAPFDGAFANCDNSEETAVDPGTVNTNTHTTTVIETVETFFTNEDYLVFEQYLLQGTATRIGTVHGAVQSALFDLSSGFAQALSDSSRGHRTAGAAPLRFWLAGHSARARTDGEGAVAGSRREIAGLAGGLQWNPLPDWRFGLGLDHSVADVEVLGAPESAEVKLTQLGADIGFDDGRWLVATMFMHGFGDASTEHGDADTGGASTARYDTYVNTLGARLGYHLPLQALRLTPMAGVEMSWGHADRFAEQGGVALTAPEDSPERNAGWLGLEAARTWNWANGRWFELDARLRYTKVLSGEERVRAVALSSAPDDELQVVSASESTTGGQLRLGASVGFGPSFSAFATLEAGRGGDDRSHRAFAGVRALW